MEQKKSYEIDMCNGPILSKMLLFTIPLMCSSMLQLLFNAADIVVVGRYAGDNSLAAEDVTIPAEHRLLYRFKSAKLKDVLSVGSEETSQAYIPVRNILYISTVDVIRW